MIDAEHSYFQPAIDHAAMEVQRRFNAKEPVVYNTYQCYLKDSSARHELFDSSSSRRGFMKCNSSSCAVCPHAVGSGPCPGGPAGNGQLAGRGMPPHCLELSAA